MSHFFICLSFSGVYVWWGATKYIWIFDKNWHATTDRVDSIDRDKFWQNFPVDSVALKLVIQKTKALYVQEFLIDICPYSHCWLIYTSVTHLP